MHAWYALDACWWLGPVVALVVLLLGSLGVAWGDASDGAHRGGV